MRGPPGGPERGATIFAVSSPPGCGTSAVVRLSGPAAITRVAGLCREDASALAESAGFTGLKVMLAIGKARIPAWAAVYRAPRSYTGEDVVELVLPGSTPLQVILCRELARESAQGHEVRWAQPGEFTLRAFLNGRLDLSQAEAVAGVISAAGEAEAKASRRALRGDLRLWLEDLSAGLLETMALVEAALDFPDEDLPQVSPGAISARVCSLCDRIRELRASSSVRVAGAATLKIVLAGFPNAGKSSLLNALLGRDAVISACQPGTTRDPVRGVTIHAGRRIEWVDLAGTWDHELRDFGGETPDTRPIWDVVRRLTRVELECADCVVWVTDPTAGCESSLAEFRRLQGAMKVLVIQKVDRLTSEDRHRLGLLAERPVLVSARERLGLDCLLHRVVDPGAVTPGTSTLRSAARPAFLLTAHQEAQLESADRVLERARETAGAGGGYELVAADLREAFESIEDLRGARTSEAILARVFSRFCVGK